MDRIYDVIIIGSGPAGMSAAIYTKRADLDVILVDAGAPGGKLLLTSKVENYPGLADVSGVDLSLGMFEQINNLKIGFKTGKVSRIEDGRTKKVILENDEILEGRSVIIASGTSERKLNVPGEDHYRGYGISYCAVCDGSLFRDKEIAVIGSGNTALEESLYLSDFVRKIHLIVRKSEFKGEKIFQDKVFANERISVLFNTSVTEITGDEYHVNGVKLIDNVTKEESHLDIAGVFPLIGAVPATAFVSELGILNEAGYIMVNEKMETSLKGIYGAGDVCAKNLRQIVTATNDGAIAAQEVYRYLNEDNSR